MCRKKVQRHFTCACNYVGDRYGKEAIAVSAAPSSPTRTQSVQTTAVVWCDVSREA